MLSSLSSRAPSRLIHLNKVHLRLLSSCVPSLQGTAPTPPSTPPSTIRNNVRTVPSKSSIISITSSQYRSIRTLPLQARQTINVPTMGDSITEGTVVEWCVEPGALVKEGDVVALIETDKVTVDIKADMDGVLIEQLGEIDGNVEVGQGLYVLDTDASVATITAADTSASSASSDNPSEEEPIPVIADEPSVGTDASASSSARVPSIQFLGKDGWKARLTATEPAASAASTAPTTTTHTNTSPNSPSTTTYIPYAPMYGRPAITEDEMDALILGGADEAPEVHKVVSKDGLSGVVFVGGKIVTAGPRGIWLAEEKM